MVLTERAMKLTGKLKEEGSTSDLAMFEDTGLLSPYAVPGVAALVKEGIIKGSNHRIDPLGNTTRAEAAVVIYRLYNWFFK
jgi:S-layer homology domain.